MENNENIDPAAIADIQSQFDQYQQELATANKRAVKRLVVKAVLLTAVVVTVGVVVKKTSTPVPAIES